MSTFAVTIQVGDPATGRFEAVEALVDTGATLTAAPRDLLARLGIRPERRERFRHAPGDVTESDVGEARVRVAGKEGTTPVVFNDPGEPSLLGAVTLESLFLGVDPVGERLIPVEGLRVSRYPL